MCLAEDNDVVQALAPDRSDQPCGKAVLPGRGWRGRLVPDVHGAQSACDDAAIDPIPIADEVTRSLIPRKCLGYLTCNPFCGRICCDVDPDEVSAVEQDDDEGIEQIETESSIALRCRSLIGSSDRLRAASSTRRSISIA